MCGRYSLTIDKQKLLQEFDLQQEHLKSISPRYNIAPSQPVLIITSQENKSKLELCQWGLIPSWAKDPSIGNRMINARKETIVEKPSYRSPFKNRRCLVLADGFYEWKQTGKTKIPYYIRLKSGAPFGMAGLWSHWQSKEGSEILSCTIITGEPNELMKPIHDRMPMIIPKNQRPFWLDHSRFESDKLLKLLEPYSENEMEAFPVSRVVNDPKNDIPDCIAPANN